LHVIVCVLQVHDTQSPSLEQVSPGPKEPGVQAGVPPVPPLEVALVPEGHVQPSTVVVVMVPHSEAQLASRHAAAAELTALRAPHCAGEAQVVSVPPVALQLTQHKQFRSPEHAW
jgi:hypothetical protein